MKKPYIIFFILVISVLTTRSQTNTFPTNANVGIGTISPAEKLHIYRNQSSYFNPLLVLEDDIASGYTQMALRGTGRSYHMGVGNGSESGFSVANKFFLYDNDANAMRVVVDATGNMGIGTTTPGNRLTIYSATASTSGLQFARLNNTSTAAASNGKVLSLDANGNVILVNEGVGTGAWSATGNAGTNPSSNFFGTTDNQDVVFRTNNLERFRLLANGNFRIGNGTDKGKTFQVNGTGYFSNSIGIGTDSINDPNYRLFVAQGIRTRKVKVDVSAWPDYVFHQNYKLPTLQEIEQYINENKHLPGIISADEADKQGVDLGENQSALLRKIEELTLYMIEHDKEIKGLYQRIDSQQDQIRALNKQLEERK